MIFFVCGKQIRMNSFSNVQHDATTIAVAILPIGHTEPIYNKIASRASIAFHLSRKKLGVYGIYVYERK